MPLKRTTYQLMFLLTIVMITSWNKWNNNTQNVKWIILKGGTLRVNGSTNINTFSCVVSDNTTADTIIFTINKEASVLMNGKINLDIFGFDCHNPMMTLDLRKTLKAKAYPTMKVHFLTLNKYPDFNLTQEELIKGWVNIELSGVTKKYEVSYRLSLDKMKVIHLIGDRTVKFSEFNMIPPRKLGGIIKANDRLDVEFSLDFKEVN